MMYASQNGSPSRYRADRVIRLSILVLLITLSGRIPVLCVIETDVVEYETWLKVSGDDTQVFENKQIIFHNTIEVEDNASLRFVNCNITLRATMNGDTQHLLLADNGTLDLVNSSLWIRVDLIPNLSTDGRIRVQDNAVFNVIGSKITCTDSIRMRCTGNSTVNISGSEYYGRAPKSGLHWSIEDMLPEGLLREYFDDYRLNCDGSSNVRITGSHVGDLSVHQNSSCNVTDSNISLLYAYSSVETLVEGSRIVVLSQEQSDSDFTFTGSVGGFYDEWDSETLFGPGHSSSLRLKDSSFDHLWLTLVNCTAEICDADLWLLSTYQGETTLERCDVWILNLRSRESTVESSSVEHLISQSVDDAVHVEDCEVQWMGLTGFARAREYRKVFAFVENSTVGSCKVNYCYITEVVNVTFRGVQFENLTMRPAPFFEVDFTVCTIADTVTLGRQRGDDDVIQFGGSVAFLGEGLVVYPESVMVREYEVKVLEEGEPVEGVEVQLSKDDVVLKSGETSGDGSAFFKVTWVDFSSDNPWETMEDRENNMTESLIVEAIWKGGVSKEITVLSDTPVIMEITKTLEIVPFVVVFIGVILIVTIYKLGVPAIIKRRR